MQVVRKENNQNSNTLKRCHSFLPLLVSHESLDNVTIRFSIFKNQKGTLLTATVHWKFPIELTDMESSFYLDTFFFVCEYTY